MDEKELRLKCEKCIIKREHIELAIENFTEKEINSKKDHDCKNLENRTDLHEEQKNSQLEEIKLTEEEQDENSIIENSKILKVIGNQFRYTLKFIILIFYSNGTIYRGCKI